MNTQNKTIINIIKLGVFVGLFSETYLNAALPEFMNIFSVPANSAQWLTAGYMLMMGIFVPVSAFLIKRTTTRQLFFAAMTAYLAGIFTAAAAVNFNMLLVGRLIQAAGTSVLLPLLMNTIMHLHSPESRGRAMGAAMLVVLFAPAIGPTYGGLILEIASWRWIFLIAALPAIGVLIWGIAALKNITGKENIRMDLISLFLSAAGFGCTVYGLHGLFSGAGTDYIGLIILAAGIISIITFGNRQLRISSPILDIRVFSSGKYALGISMILITHMILFANFILMPIFLVNILGVSVFYAGLIVLPGGILGAVLPPVAGRIYDRFGPGVIVPSGFALMTAANFIISGFSETTGIPTVIAVYAAVISGLAVILTPTQTFSLNQLEKKQISHGTAMLNTVMLIGASMGASFFVGIMSSRLHFLAGESLSPPQALLGGLNFAYLFVACISAAGLILSLLLKPRKVRQPQA